jgi:hypothetical protein
MKSDGAVPEPDGVPGHAFICYVREDAARVDRLQRLLEDAGIPVWRDTSNLWPGQDWKAEIRRAITDDALVFLACFSCNSAARERSEQNEELTLAIDELRVRRPGVAWLIPVRLDDCRIPDRDTGGGRTLATLRHADLFGNRYEQEAARLVEAVQSILGRRAVGGDTLPSATGRAANPGNPPGPGPERRRLARTRALIAAAVAAPVIVAAVLAVTSIGLDSTAHVPSKEISASPGASRSAAPIVSPTPVIASAAAEPPGLIGPCNAEAGTATQPVTTASVASSVQEWYAQCDDRYAPPVKCAAPTAINSAEAYYKCSGIVSQTFTFLVNLHTGSWVTASGKIVG